MSTAEAAAESSHDYPAGTEPALDRPAAYADAPKGHWPALDGLRAIAVLAVIGIHVGLFPGGYLGVDVFYLAMYVPVGLLYVFVLRPRSPAGAWVFLVRAVRLPDHLAAHR